MLIVNVKEVRKPSHKAELNVGLDTKEAERFNLLLSRLIPHLDPERFALVGSTALRHHLTTRGINYPNKVFNDLDLYIENIDVILPSLGGSESDFLISHFHPPGNYPNRKISFTVSGKSKNRAQKSPRVVYRR